MHKIHVCLNTAWPVQLTAPRVKVCTFLCHVMWQREARGRSACDLAINCMQETGKTPNHKQLLLHIDDAFVFNKKSLKMYTVYNHLRDPLQQRHKTLCIQKEKSPVYFQGITHASGNCTCSKQVKCV